MTITTILSDLNLVAPGLTGLSSCSDSPIGKSRVSCSARRVISLVNIRSSCSKQFHNNNKKLIQFSSRLNTVVRSGRITILCRSKQFSCCSRNYNNNATSLEEGAVSTCTSSTSLDVGDDNNNNDNANTRTSYDTMGVSSSYDTIGLSSSSCRSCSCNYDNTNSTSLDVGNENNNNDNANTRTSYDTMGICSRSCSCNYDNNNDKNNYVADTSPSSYDRMGGSSSSLYISSSSTSCSCNCQNNSPFIQINFVFPHWFPLSASPIAILAHVYSNLHPLMDQLMMSVRGGSLILFQIAVLDKKQVLRRKLNRIAEKADTSTLNGLNYTLKGAVKAILQCNNSYFHFTKIYERYDSMKSLSKRFEECSSQELERHGEDEDTLVNADNNVKYAKKSRRIQNEYTVVTLLVLATGKHSIPYITEKGRRYYVSSEVLQTLQCIPKKEIQSVKVLWSPRKEGEVLLEDELLIDFPKLIPTVLKYK